MFKAKSGLKEGFTVNSRSANDKDYKLFFEKGQDGPMDLFTVALSGCILMCAKGYFVRTYNDKGVPIDIDLNVDYENKKFVAQITVDYPDFTEKDKLGLLENIKLRCKISHLLSEEVDRIYKIIKK